MGNTIAFESQGAGEGPQDENTSWNRTNSEVWKRHGEICPKGLHRKSSSFLTEPVTSKLTERGEVITSLFDACKTADNGQRDHQEVETDSINKLLRYAVSEMQGWRSHMEDKHLLNPKLSTTRQQEQLLEDHHLFAIFDGHRGDFSSNFCGKNFVPTLAAQEDWKTYLKLSSKGSTNSKKGLSLLKSALTATFLELDSKLMEAQRQRRISQLSHLKDLVCLMTGNVEECDVFQPGTEDQESVLNFSKSLPATLPSNVPFECSGSTGVVVLITPSHVLCANAGDSRAVLSKRSEGGWGEVLPLSFDHKPHKDVELCRVERDGGFVSRNRRVDGKMAVSRGFGDYEYKNCAARDGRCSDSLSSGDSQSSASTAASLPKDDRITVHPDIIVHTREPDSDEFVVLACDGIWDKLSNRRCADLIRDLVYDEGETDMGLICEEVIDTALELKSWDNMTLCIVLFPVAEISEPNVHGGLSRREKRTWKRLRSMESISAQHSQACKRKQQA